MNSRTIYELHLLDVRGKLAADPKVTVQFFRASDGRPIGTRQRIKSPPQARFSGLPTFPQGRRLFCEITPSKFHHRKSGFFVLRVGRTVKSELIVLRRPSRWRPQFGKWNQLPGRFRPLKNVLQTSSSLRLRGKNGRLLRRFVGATYDNVRGKQAKLAKACLLNLFAKMTALGAPTTRRNWFSFVREILEIGQDRFIALVDPKMGEVVRRIIRDIAQFKDYKRTPARNHFKNIPASFSPKQSQMFSIKSRDVLGNLQLVLAAGRDSQGNDVLVLDVDIDENGKLLPHFFDFLKHRATGKKTHPFEIHEYLALAHPTVPLGYELV